MRLTKKIKKGDRVIKTTQGDFKVRKNGRIYMCIAPNTKNEEIVRVTPLLTQPNE